MNAHNDSIKRLVPIVLSQTVGLLCGVAGIKIASHLVPPAIYGAYGVFLTLTPLGIAVVHAGLLKFVARHWAASENKRGLLREVCVSAVRKLPWLALLAFAAVRVAPGLDAAGAWWRTWALLFLAAALYSAAVIAQTALQAGREHWRDFGASAAGSVTRSFGPPLLYALAGGTLVALQAGFVVHAAVLALAAIGFCRGAPCVRPHSRDMQEGGRAQGAPLQLTPIYDGPLFVVLAVAAWVLLAANRWIVAGFFGNESAGFFTLAGNVAVIVTGILGGVFLQYWQPVFFAMPSASAGERKALARRIDLVALGYMACGLGGVAVLHIVVPHLTGVLIDAGYAGSFGMIAPAGCFGVAIIAGQFFHAMLLAAKKEQACLAADLSGAIVLVAGGAVAAAFGGETWFMRWLFAAPFVPWLLQRTLARRALFHT